MELQVVLLCVALIALYLVLGAWIGESLTAIAQRTKRNFYLHPVTYGILIVLWPMFLILGFVLAVIGVLKGRSDA